MAPSTWYSRNGGGGGEGDGDGDGGGGGGPVSLDGSPSARPPANNSTLSDSHRKGQN